MATPTNAEGKLPLSVVMISRNEEAHIGRAVASALFAEDIVVVDAESKDRGPAIATALGARVLSRAWTNFSDQRNFSLAQAKHHWVLVIDADEAISPGLENWLREFFRSGAADRPPWGYKIRRAEYFLGKEITGACWNPSYQDRFFFRARAKYVGEIHEYPEVDGKILADRAPSNAYLEHNPKITAESFLDKMNRYTTIEAFDRYRAGQRTNIPHLAIVFPATWWKNFVYYKGYRDGAHGFIICLMEAVSRTVRHIKLWQIQQMHKENKAHLLPDPRASLAAAAHRSMEAYGDGAASRPAPRQ